MRKLENEEMRKFGNEEMRWSLQKRASVLIVSLFNFGKV